MCPCCAPATGRTLTPVLPTLAVSVIALSTSRWCKVWNMSELSDVKWSNSKVVHCIAIVMVTAYTSLCCFNLFTYLLN